ncbi:hypothetical protein E2562_035970 [Oryza meyeriana var. granulata]|uniref:Uncharacterized protein n=1 Tax=Oryza meyeriana var. granulata TaxID=110450 RepID=A0A6G1ESZ5_9ORYZ|nr:hypothetical protein E2562_035970 [Oryza meyeriana var. granulata]
MGNSLRCCLACMLPCGALDVVRVVHLSGHVDEFTCPLTAGDVLAAHPNHALTAAWSGGGGAVASRKILIVSPDSELKRGRIYFLIPSACSAPAAEKIRSRRKIRASAKKRHGHGKVGSVPAASTVEQDNYLMELLSEKRETSHRRRRSGARAGVWRPQLESIAEEASD